MAAIGAVEGWADEGTCASSPTICSSASCSSLLVAAIEAAVQAGRLPAQQIQLWRHAVVRLAGDHLLVFGRLGLDGVEERISHREAEKRETLPEWAEGERRPERQGTLLGCPCRSADLMCCRCGLLFVSRVCGRWVGNCRGLFSAELAADGLVAAVACCFISRVCGRRGGTTLPPSFGTHSSFTAVGSISNHWP